MKIKINKNLILKKVIGVIALIIFVFSLLPSISSAALSVNAYFFYGNGCPHCAKERDLLYGFLKDKYPTLNIYEYEIYYNHANALLLQSVAQELGVGVDGVPFLVIGDQHFIGYAEGLSAEIISKKVADCTEIRCFDSVAAIVGLSHEVINNNVNAPSPLSPTVKPTQPVVQEQQSVAEVEEQNITTNGQKIITLPFIGDVDGLKFSLPILTIIMGVLDGFNPCAMWVLLFLISLLLGMQDRKKMWIIGSVFVVSSAFVYFLFMAAWLNLILFLGFIIWVRILIGLLALGGGLYNLKEYLFNKETGCKVTGSEKRQKVFERMKIAIQQNSLWLAIGGIIILAFMVNLVELICSAGLPAIYVQVLALNQLAGWQYYGYILLYIFFFMIDDLLVFFVAMVTLEMVGVTTKYARVSRLVGGLLMLLIGCLLIFKPQWLMFG